MTKLFDKVLVANRGEIACRVIRTCRRLGIRTVAVYSEADAQAMHVSMADEAVFIGPSPPLQSYLNIEALVAVCKDTGAQAVHPGCGFLSEHPSFAEALERNNIAFVGPPARVLRLMGDKMKAKAMARAAGLPCIPGTETAVRSGEDVRAFARRVGYPVLIKACAGGGGKGIRVVRNESECDTLHDLCKDEAHRFFGDATLMAEKLVARARHVEVQVLADSHGHIVCFPERECSVQRRNQKVVEETPCALFDAHPDLRERAMGFAHDVARASGFVSAGTVEFMVTASGERGMYFLEVNPRLQVEHTITEMVTGTDLVEQMLRVAAGEPLAVCQTAVATPRGHATEVRVQAEDPQRDFAPSVGRIHEYAEPATCLAEKSSVRCDSGVATGSVVSLYYDSLLLKLCAWGENREVSIARTTSALDELVLRGVSLNVGLAYRILGSAAYARGDLDTDSLESLASSSCGLSAEETRLVCLLTACVRYEQESELCKSFTGDAVTHAVEYYTASPHAQPCRVAEIVTVRAGDSHWLVCQPTSNGTHAVMVRIERQNDSPIVRATLRTDDSDVSVVFQHFGSTDEMTHSVAFKGCPLDVVVCSPLQQSLGDELSRSRAACLPESHSTAEVTTVVRATMPGQVVDLFVKAGDHVEPGQDLATMEAMKMRTRLRAPISGRVRDVQVCLDTTVKSGDVILTISPD